MPPPVVVPNIWPISAINYAFLPPNPPRPDPGHVAVSKAHWEKTPREFVESHAQQAVFALFGLLALYTGPAVADCAEWQLRWMLHILLRDFIICDLSYGLWHWLIRWSPLAPRIKPYMFSQKYPSDEQTRRDFWYTQAGILHGSLTEIVLYKAWANCSFVPLLGSYGPQVGCAYYSDFWAYPLWSITWTLFVVYWREFHFYLAHRSIHPWRRFGKYDPGAWLYRNFHSLHHKSYNPNAWDGMSMHPVEHIFYFSCCWIPLLLVQHPFHFLFNKYHLYTSPIAGGHDGLNGPFHWLHHAHFECNYGSSSCPLDKFFGTFEDGSRYLQKGAGGDLDGEAAAKPKDD